MTDTPRSETSLQGLGALAAAAVGMAFGFGNISWLSFGLFIVPLAQAKGWERGDISLGFTILSSSVIVTASVAGLLLSRYGVRRVLLPSLLFLGLAVASLAFVGDRLWQFYLTYMIIAVVGAGSLPTAYTRIVIDWFDDRRGLALSVALAGAGLGGVVIPPFVQYFLSNGGLQTAYLALGGIVLLLVLPITTLFLKERTGAPSVEAIARLSLRHQCRSPVFVKLLLCFLFLGCSTGGILAHLVPLLTDRGLSAERAAWTMSALAGLMTVGRLLGGYLLDRFYPPLVVATFLSGPTIGLAALACGGGGDTAMLFAVLLGIGIGSEYDFMSYLTSRYLPLHCYSQNYGTLYSMYCVGTAIGPMLMGYSLQRLTSYDAGLWLLSGLTFVALAICLSLGRPPRIEDKALKPALAG